MTRLPLFAAIFALTLTACDSSETETLDIIADQAADVPADPAQRDPTTGVTQGTNNFTLFSLRVEDDTTTAVDERIVVSYDDTERADSASTRWDIGFNGTDIILNGGSSGPGAALGVVVPEAFVDLEDALANDYTYRRDGESPCPDIQTPVGPVPGASRAVCGGSGNGWYTYVPFPGGRGGYIVPTAGRTLLVRLADGQGYAKVAFTSYYQGSPDPAAITDQSQDRFYSFKFVTNPTGSSFEPDMEM